MKGTRKEHNRLMTYFQIHKDNEKAPKEYQLFWILIYPSNCNISPNSELYTVLNYLILLLKLC